MQTLPHNPHVHAHMAPPAAGPAPSLLRLSAGGRLASVAALLAALWTAVFWVVG